MAQRKRSAYFLLTALVSALCPLTFAELSLSLEPGIGYKTNVSALGDSVIDDYPYATVSVNPAYAFFKDRRWNAALSAAAEYTRYFSGPVEWNVDPALSLSRSTESYSTGLRLNAGYFAAAGSYDPTIPKNFSIITGSAEYAQKKAKIPVSVQYSLSMINDAGSDRIDYRNSLKCKLSWKPGKGKSVFIKPGMIWTVSNDQITSYVQPSISGGYTQTFLSKYMLLAQTSVAYPFYGTVAIKKTGKGKGRVITTAESVHYPRIPHIMVNAGVWRGILENLDIFINYQLFMLDPGAGNPLYISNGVCLSMELNVAHLLPFDK